MILIKIYFPACNLWSPSQTRLPFENANGGTYWKRGCRSCWNKNSSLFRFRGNCWNGNNNGMLWRTNENSSNIYMRLIIFKAVPFLMWTFFRSPMRPKITWKMLVVSVTSNVILHTPSFLKGLSPSGLLDWPTLEQTLQWLKRLNQKPRVVDNFWLKEICSSQRNLQSLKCRMMHTWQNKRYSHCLW